MKKIRKYKLFELSGSPGYWKTYVLAGNKESANKKGLKKIYKGEMLIPNLTTHYATVTRQEYKEKYSKW